MLIGSFMENLLENYTGWGLMWVSELSQGYWEIYSRWTKYSNPAAHTMLNPRAPRSQCFGARVSKSDVEGLISFVHWG